MCWRTFVGWLPLSLFVVLSAAGALLYASDSGPDVLLVGTLDGSQLGMLLVLVAAVSGVIALIQSAVLAGRIERPLWRILIRLIAGLLLAAAVPFGYLLVLVAALTTVNSYEPLAVRGHNVVVRTFSWHHRSLELLEQDGLLFRRVPICGDPLPVDAYDAFSAGRFEVAPRGGREVIRFAEGPGEPLTRTAVLGARPGEDISASCTPR